MTEAISLEGEIERRILDGTISPGTRVNENAIAAEFNVSRASVRDAVRALEQFGLVRIEANRGAVVRCLELSDVMHIYDMWSSISRTAGRLVTLRASSAQLGILSDLHDQMIDLSEKDDTIRYHPLNTAFHSSLFEFSGNPRLAQLHTQISKEMRLFSKHGIIGVGSLRVSAHEHAEILQAIKAGDAERAAVAFETHVLHGKQRILDSLLKGRDLV